MTAPEVGSDIDQWGAHLNGDLFILDALFPPNGTGTEVGLHVGPTMTLQIDGTATLNITSTATVNMPAASLYLEDDSDATKIAKFQCNALTTGTTSTFILPNGGGTVATQAYVATQKQVVTGTMIQGFFGNTAPTGTVFANGFTIGNASSGATARANADTYNLYAIMWNYLGYIPTGGAGANAAADFAANKPIALPDMRGKVGAALDNLGGATNAGLLTASGIASTTPGATGGQSTTTATLTATGPGVSLTGGCSVGVTVSGSLSGSASANATAGGGGGAGPLCGQGAPVTVSGSLSGGGSGTITGTTANLSVTGSTSSFVTVQPTMMVQYAIYL